MKKHELSSRESLTLPPAPSITDAKRLGANRIHAQRSMPNSVRRFAKRLGLPISDEVRRIPLRVLVSDDDQQLNRLMVELIRTWSQRLTIDVDIECVFDGFDAEAKVASFMPNIILLDLTMPRLDGFSVCRKIKTDAHTNHIRVVALSGHVTKERIDRILAAGADRFVQKPFSSAELLEACGLAAFGKSSLDSEAATTPN